MSHTCDTSVLVPALLPAHPHHEAAAHSLQGVTAAPAHVLLETYSVLTRLAGDNRVGPPDAAWALDALGWEPLPLPGDNHLRLIARLATGGIRGGATYDALIAATAQHHGLSLLTLDVRARATYEAVGVPYAVVAG